MTAISAANSETWAMERAEARETVEGAVMDGSRKVLARLLRMDRSGNGAGQASAAQARPQRIGHAASGLQHVDGQRRNQAQAAGAADRKSTRLNSSHLVISYAVF